jgi:hypothetical protein
MHISFKIIKFYFTLCCSTCFGHHCVHHQELFIAAHAVCGHRVVLGRLFPPALFCCYCCFCSSNNRTNVHLVGFYSILSLMMHGTMNVKYEETNMNRVLILLSYFVCLMTDPVYLAVFLSRFPSI